MRKRGNAERRGKMEIKRKIEKREDEGPRGRVLALPNDKWRPQDCASDIQLARPSSPCSGLFPDASVCYLWSTPFVHSYYVRCRTHRVRLALNDPKSKKPSPPLFSLFLFVHLIKGVQMSFRLEFTTECTYCAVISIFDPY